MAAKDKDYASYQDIREESGQQHLNKLESLTGTVDGSNKTFTVKRTYVVDRDYDDRIDNNDVIVYDDNVAVDVDEVDCETGTVTLVLPPASSSVMLVTYAHSALSDTLIEKRRDEAIDCAQRMLKGYLDYTTWEAADVPPVVKTFVRLYAGGLILIRDEGLNTDVEETSKDGYKKISSAKSLLKSFIEEVAGSAGSTARVSVSTKSDGNIFKRETDLTNNAATDSTAIDEHFFRDR